MPAWQLATSCSLFFVALTWIGIVFIKPFLQFGLRNEPDSNTLVAQASSGLTYTKSDSATSATRQCIALSNGSLLHFFNSTKASQWSSANLLTFGDVPSLKPNDLYNTYLMAGTPTEAVAGVASIGSTSTGHYICRAHTNTGSALQVGKYPDGTTGTITTPFGGAGPAYPSPVSGRSSGQSTHPN